MQRAPLLLLTSARPTGRLLLLLGVLALQACGSAPTPGRDDGGLSATGALITFETCASPGAAPQRLTIFSSRESFIVDAERMVAGGARQVPMFDLRLGQGVDPQWDWHVDPETTAFGDVGPAFCDGCPADVASNLRSWLDLGTYCPWTASVTQVVRTH